MEKDGIRKEWTWENQERKIGITEWKPLEIVFVKNITKLNNLAKQWFGPYQTIRITITKDSLLPLYLCRLKKFYLLEKMFEVKAYCKNSPL